jgi:hypothetical protein
MGFMSNGSKGLLIDQIHWFPLPCRQPKEDAEVIYQTPRLSCSRYKEMFASKNPQINYLVFDLGRDFRV